MSVKNHVLPNYVDKKLQTCKMSKLQIFLWGGSPGPGWSRWSRLFSGWSWCRWSHRSTCAGSAGIRGALQEKLHRFKAENFFLLKREQASLPGVDVMIIIFCDFWQFSAKKIAFFSKTNVMIKILHNLALFWVKNAYFFAKCFGKNIFKIITSVPANNAYFDYVTSRNRLIYNLASICYIGTFYYSQLMKLKSPDYKKIHCAQYFLGIG
jgi:hypothetical protein